MAYKLPKLGKVQTGWAKTAIDPLGIGLGDAIFGANEGPDYSAEKAAQEAAIAQGQAATDAFIAGGPAQYAAGDELDWQYLSPAERQAQSEMFNISTDPRYRDAELAALRDLEEQSKNGITAADRADMARTESQQNRANRGRLGAIQQNMQARGMSGSGMDLVAQMQAAQDSTEIEAMKALEREGMMQTRKQDATSRMGSLAGQLQGRDFSQQAQAASAQDAINRFNTQNTNSVSLYNNQGVNRTAGNNWDRTNQTSDRNAGAGYDHRRNVLGAQQGQAGMNYNYSVDGENNRRLEDAAAEERASGKMGMITGIAGAGLGAMAGGPAGAQAGYGIGSGVGRQVGSNAYRNSYGSDKRLKDNIQPEHPLEIEAFLASIAPKSFDYKEGEGEKGKHGVLADDLVKTSIGRSIVTEDERGAKAIKVNDAISALLQAVSHLNKKVGM